jgi:hypothetical protein
MTALPALQADFRQRAATDWKTNFCPAFLLSLVTCGIYGIYILYKLLERREQHFKRMVSFRGHLIDVLRRKPPRPARQASWKRFFPSLKA